MATQWTLLTIVQEFCRRQAMRVPANVVTSTDEGVLQMLGLLNEEIDDVTNRPDWRGLHNVLSFTHLGGANYLALSLAPDSTLLGNDRTILYIVNQTLWCETQKIPVAGPIPDSQWQGMIVQTIQPAVFSFRMGGLGLQIYPMPSPLADTTFSIEVYQRESIVYNNNGLTEYKDQFSNDSDVPLLPGNLLLAGLRWRWRAEKGLPYAEHQRMYEQLLQQLNARDGQAPEIDLTSSKLYPNVAAPGLLIPAGNWNV